MFFLAIVSHEDLLAGNIEPSYTLCWSQGNSPNRSSWRVYRANASFTNIRKVLVKHPSGNEAMIDFLSHYRTRDYMHTKKSKRAHQRSKKYYPEGALFWFECNEYGEKTGAAIFVKRIPDPSISTSDDGLRRLIEYQSQRIHLNDLFCRDPFAVPLKYSSIKPRLFQWSAKD